MLPFAAVKILREARWSSEEIEDTVVDFFQNKLAPLWMEIFGQSQSSKSEQKAKAMDYISAVFSNKEAKVWMREGPTRGCQCGKSLHIASRKISEVAPKLCSTDLLNAIKSDAVQGCVAKHCTINKEKLRNAAHVRILLGKFINFNLMLLYA